MHLTLVLENESSAWDVPVHYNALVQGALYRNLTPEFGEFLHNQGFVSDGRRFALFAFSRLLGDSDYIAETKTLRFRNPVRLIVASPVERFIRETGRLLLREGVRLGKQLLRVSAVELDAPRVEGASVEVEALSPVVAYSTMYRSDGRKFTAYFQPRETDFQRIVADNLVRKAKLLYGEEAEFGPIRVMPVGRPRKQVVIYKDTIIEGYTGRFRLEGDVRLIQTAIDAGLGGKNSAGFGLVREVGENNS